ncbi:hypothetical protein H5410_061124, partial [Solanum commersonii]
GISDPPFGQFYYHFALAFSIFKFCNFRRYSIASRNRSTTRRLLLSIADLIFSFRVWHTGALGETGHSATCPMLSCSFLLISVHAFFRNPNTLKSRIYITIQKDVLNSATQDSIMNTHKKTQLTHARFNCALKDSSCDLPLPKNLKLNKGTQMPSHKE